jgi:hypothetical protein
MGNTFRLGLRLGYGWFCSLTSRRSRGGGNPGGMAGGEQRDGRLGEHCQSWSAAVRRGYVELERAWWVLVLGAGGRRHPAERGSECLYGYLYESGGS